MATHNHGDTELDVPLVVAVAVGDGVGVGVAAAVVGASVVAGAWVVTAADAVVWAGAAEVGASVGVAESVAAASAWVLACSLGAAGLAAERVTFAATLVAKPLTASFTDPAWLHAVTMQTAIIIHPTRTHFAAALRMASSFSGMATWSPGPSPRSLRPASPG
jgi:hypothetical protein